jgi:chromosome partitioning protein
MNVVGVFSIKGGVGKTAAAANLAYTAARRWGQTLLWDLDPQSACSFYFRTEVPSKKGRLKALLRDKQGLRKQILGTNYEYLDILGSDAYASAVEQMGTQLAPVQTYAGWTDAARAYSDLWTEVQTRLRRI